MLWLLGDEGDFVPHTPNWGSAPGPRWGTPIPQTPAPLKNLWPPFGPPNSGSLEPPLLPCNRLCLKLIINKETHVTKNHISPTVSVRQDNSSNTSISSGFARDLRGTCLTCEDHGNVSQLNNNWERITVITSQNQLTISTNQLCDGRSCARCSTTASLIVHTVIVSDKFQVRLPAWYKTVQCQLQYQRTATVLCHCIHHHQHQDFWQSYSTKVNC